MRSSEPLADIALKMLAEIEPGGLSRLDGGAKHDLDLARSSSPAERLAALNEILLLAEALGVPEPSRAPIQYHDLLL